MLNLQQNTILKFRSLESINKIILEGDYESALNTIFVLCSNLVNESGFKFKYVHIPELDQSVQEIGKCVYKQQFSNLTTQEGEHAVNLIIATELYQVGGHTRVLEDIVSVARKPTVVVLTDIFDRYATGQLVLGSVFNNLNRASVIVIPKMRMLDKLKNLFNLIRFLKPNTLGILAHHQDVVAFSACNDLIKTQQVFVHHADHNPTLGATMKHYVHMDLTLGNQRFCVNSGVTNTVYLPLFGKKRFRSSGKNGQFSTAMSGTFNKFTTEGDFAYTKIVKTILKKINGQHYHIGPIPDDYLKIICSDLIESGIDPSRFRYLGVVDSLSDTLFNNNIDVYLTSAPVGGGKAYVEALGCGIAIIRFKKFFDGLTTSNYNEEYSYSPDHLSWETLDELDHALSHIDLSLEFEKSQKYFMLHHNPEHFLQQVYKYF